MKKLITCLLALSLLLVSCQDSGIDSSPELEASASKESQMKLMQLDIDKSVLFKKGKTKDGGFANQVAAINEALLEHGIQLVKMEFLGAEGAGNTVYFKNVGNKQLGADFVPNDFRNWFPRNPFLGEWTDGSLGYWMDGTELRTSSGMTESQTIKAFQSVMNTWGSVNCSNGLVMSNQGVTSTADYGDVGIMQAVLGFGGSFGTAPGTIVQAGNLPADFFEAVGLLDPDGAPGGGAGILGVTFTFVWQDRNGPTDIDNNGKNDVFVREIYMNDGFNWQDAPDDVRGNDVFDYETVMLHEVGHGLSQGHFGKKFMTNKNGKEHYAPYALMNPSYSIAQREITATDNAGHCSNWGSWPNN